MKIGFIGCVKTSEMALNTLLSMDNGNIEVVAVITKRHSPLNTDHVDLSNICKIHDIPCCFEETNQQCNSLDFFGTFQPDIIYCIGWSYLLSDKFLTLAERGVIGFHPTNLPFNRGRHPLIWALALGLDKTASSFFKMTEQVDAGPILSQKEIVIFPEDDAKSLYDKVLRTAEQQIREFTPELAVNRANFTPQDHIHATTWRKRTQKDGVIDWRMKASDIYNLIRALTSPYCGAEFDYQGLSVKVWQSVVCTDEFSNQIEPGRVLTIENNNLCIKTGDNTAIKLIDLHMQHLPSLGDYL